jgi:hypothetical protein
MSPGAQDRPGIVLGFPFAGQVREAFESRFELLGVVERGDPALVTPAIAAGARGYVTMGSIAVGEALMAALPKLSIICCFGSGFEGIDLAAAQRRRITVTNGGDANAPDVADMAMALLLASTRRVAQADRYVRGEKWTARGGWLGPVAEKKTGQPPARKTAHASAEIDRRMIAARPDSCLRVKRSQVRVPSATCTDLGSSDAGEREKIDGWMVHFDSPL